MQFLHSMSIYVMSLILSAKIAVGGEDSGGAFASYKIIVHLVGVFCSQEGTVSRDITADSLAL